MEYGVYGFNSHCLDLTIEYNEIDFASVWAINCDAVNYDCDDILFSKINNNCISNVTGGIRLRESKRGHIYNNTIDGIFSQSAISLEGGLLHKVQSNYIDVGYLGGSTSSSFEGIRVADCFGSKFTCNQIFNAHTAAHFLGTSKSYFLNNKMYSSIEGVALSNNGMMGPQVSSNFASDNQWFDIDYDLYTNEGVDGSLSPFYVVGNDDVSFVPESSGFNLNLIIQITELTTHNVIPCNYSYSCQNNSLTDSLQLDFNNDVFALEDIINGGMIYDSPEEEFISRQTVFERIDKTPLLSESSEVLQQFQIIESQHCSGKLVQVKNCIDRNDVASLLEAQVILTNELIPENYAEATSIELYSIIVNNLLEGGSISQLDSIEKAIVESIAWLCPFTEGNAVYRARGIMNYINSEHVQYTNECEIQTQNHVSPGEKSNRTEAEEIKMILFPNPASDFIYVELSDKSEVDEIKLFSSTGKELGVNNQLKTKKGIRISLAGLSPGVYFIRSGALSEKLTITSN